MKKPVIKLFDKIIVVLLGFLGIFGGCKQECNHEMNGAPYADRTLNGVVTDKETSNPIKNICVINQTYSDTIYTNAEGKYAFSYHGNIVRTFHLKIEDIDGEENGGDFETQEIDVTFTKEDQVEPGDGNLYDGKFVKTQNIELQKKETH